jgi:hypothetical protein
MVVDHVESAATSDVQALARVELEVSATFAVRVDDVDKDRVSRNGHEIVDGGMLAVPWKRCHR